MRIAPQVEMVSELQDFLAANEAAYGYRPDVYAGVLTNGRDADRYMGWQLAQAALNARAGGDDCVLVPKQMHVDADAWAQPRLMSFLQAQGNIEPEEMARTFNCGIGMAVVVAEGDVAGVTAALEAAGETVFRIGHIAEGAKGCTVTGSSETWSAIGAWSATHNA